MSEISKDLQDQMAAGLSPSLKRFFEQKPGYDGPTLSADQENELAREEHQRAMKTKIELIEKELKR